MPLPLYPPWPVTPTASISSNSCLKQPKNISSILPMSLPLLTYLMIVGCLHPTLQSTFLYPISLAFHPSPAWASSTWVVHPPSSYLHARCASSFSGSLSPLSPAHPFAPLLPTSTAVKSCFPSCNCIGTWKDGPALDHQYTNGQWKTGFNSLLALPQYALVATSSWA